MIDLQTLGGRFRFTKDYRCGVKPALCQLGDQCIEQATGANDDPQIGQLGGIAIQLLYEVKAFGVRVETRAFEDPRDDAKREQVVEAEEIASDMHANDLELDVALAVSGHAREDQRGDLKGVVLACEDQISIAAALRVGLIVLRFIVRSEAGVAGPLVALEHTLAVVEQHRPSAAILGAGAGDPTKQRPRFEFGFTNRDPNLFLDPR